MQYLFCLLVICTELNSANFRLRKFVRTCAYCVYASLLHKRAGLSSDSPTDENRSAMQALACIAGVRILRARRRELAHKSREQKYSRKARNSPTFINERHCNRSAFFILRGQKRAISTVFLTKDFRKTCSSDSRERPPERREQAPEPSSNRGAEAPRFRRQKCRNWQR